MPLLAAKDVACRIAPSLLAADASKYGFWQAVPSGSFDHCWYSRKQWHTENTQMFSIAHLLHGRLLRPRGHDPAYDSLDATIDTR